jgi:DNA-binding response OmpR family regulator
MTTSPDPAEATTEPRPHASGSDVAAPAHPADSGDAHHERAPEQTMSVLLYSDDIEVREAVKLAVGRRAAADLPVIRWTEVATPKAAVDAVDAGGLDVLVLDGEAVPAGGMGLCKQLKDEIFQCPPVLVLTGRPQDAWLATWSRADLAVPHPLDPVAVAQAVAELARQRLG